jgi:glucokinase
MSHKHCREDQVKDLVIAVDLGGTQLRVAVLDSSYHILARHAEPTEVEEGVDAVLDRLIGCVRNVGDQADWQRISGVGVSAPGPLDPWRGVIHWAPNLPGWREVPLTDRLCEAVGRPVWMGNDGNVAALAEQRFGAGKGQLDLVYITVSTGIGGGIVSHGQIVLGHDGLGGEVGHMTVQADGPRCNCGNIGCLEAVASGTAIARQAQELLALGARTHIADLVDGDPERITAKVVHEAARQGDVVAVDLFRKAGMYLGIGIVNLMYLFNPGTIVIGGGVAKAGDLLFVPMQATIHERIHEIYWKGCPVVPADLGDDVCLMGAAILAVEALEGR